MRIPGISQSAAAVPTHEQNGVEVSHVSKMYRVSTGSVGRTASLLLHRLVTRRMLRELWALRNVSFNVRRGEILGIVGTNGSGKSTLLRVITGITQATGGEVRRRPRVAALLDLSAGFHPSLTGFENLFLSGSILGIPREELRAKLDDIKAFSGLDDEYLESPVRYYSSGMLARLGFALAVSYDPDVVLVDEVLAVGDAEFQSRSAQRLLEFRNEGKTMILVSHLIEAVQQLSDNVIWLHDGEIREAGDPHTVTSNYRRYINRRIADRRAHEADELALQTLHRSEEQGTAHVEFAHVAFEAANPAENPVFSTGAAVALRADVIPDPGIRPFEIIVSVYHDTGTLVEEFSLRERGFDTASIRQHSTLRITFDPLLLSAGQFQLVLRAVDVSADNALLGSSAEVGFTVRSDFSTRAAFLGELPCEFEIF